MPMRKSDAESELDKQYREYKLQFEDWKEKNKNAQGTEAYNQYVKQFEVWEKDVEKRRKSIREKAEKDAYEARMAKEEEERQRRSLEQKEAEAAEAYRQSQQAYLAHHQAALEAEKAQQQVMAPHHATIYSRTDHHTMDTSIRDIIPTPSIPAVGTGGVDQQAPATTAQLWGKTKQFYDIKDPLYTRWGMRAAPSHVPPHQVQAPIIVPCWMVMEQLQEQKKALAPSFPPPPLFQMGGLAASAPVMSMLP